ncbi:tetratricopeptide repeat protein [Deinococcus cavernae]|nr:tetratricopeptide repeat protein [Deinococcus cavernae]
MPCSTVRVQGFTPARLLDDLAGIKREMGAYHEAIDLYEQGLALIREALSRGEKVYLPRVLGDTAYQDVSHTAFLEMKYWTDSSIDVFKAYRLPNN